MSKANEESQRMMTVVADNYPNYICYICHLPFYCKVACKRHVKKCEEKYKTPSKDEIPGIGHQHESPSPVVVLTSKTTSEIQQTVLLDNLLASKILDILRSDLENPVVVDRVGNDVYLDFLSKKLEVKKDDLCRWLGIQTTLECKGNIQTF